MAITDSNSAANSITEGVAPGTAVGITVVSDDPGGPWTYSLDINPGGLFVIDPITGVVRTAPGASINYEDASAYTILVTANDGVNSNSQFFNINVVDLAPSTPTDNDAAPTVVLEGSSAGSTVGLTVRATDPAGGTLTYSLTDDAGGRFVIDASTGVVRTAFGTTFDFETSSGPYTITALASDGTLSSTQSFVIAVGNVAPTIDGLSPTAVNEGVPVGTVIGEFSGTDPQGGAIIYTLTSNVGGHFEIVGNQLRTLAAINYDTGATREITVQATNSGDASSSSRSFTITVNNVAPGSPFDVDSTGDGMGLSGTVLEGTTAGRSTGITAQAIDPAGGTITYSLADDASGRFQINSVTGVVTTTSAALDYESTPGNAYTIVVRATDSGSLFSQQSYVIAITNAAPVFTDSDAATNLIAEGAPATGTAVGLTIVASDPGGGVVNYTLTNDAGGRFEMDSNGVITTAAGAVFDYDASGGVYAIEATGTDSAGGTTVQTFLIGVATTGTESDDSYIAPLGPAQIDALHGVDTITFGFNLTDATITYSGSKVIIDGPGASYAILSGFEKYVFTDGTVNNADGNDLVDDLFYFSRNHDVWNAHMDAEAHYEQYGWREGRDPDAFFSTAIYLSQHPELKAGNVSPVTDFHQTGWKSGLAPSLNFDPAAYLDANPDVKAAGLDPLAHFLYWGRQEGREPIAPTEIIGKGGFDYVYYLQQNPDVAAANIDPLLHFNTIGWKQGRDPNAFFDTSGYLAVYTDVAAINMNPLDHYNQYGWKEGRDPSLDFDTKAYLAINTDVAAAQMNPLIHYLVYGQHEGRSPMSDTTWWGA